MILKKFILTLLFFEGSLIACTSFVLQEGGPNYLAKNLDWEIDRGYIFYNLAGIEKTSTNDPGLTWISKYNSITNNQFGKEFPLGGINEKGLAIEEMNSYRQGYEYDKGKHSVNEFQWVQYQLDNSATVNDVINSFKTLTIKHDILELHYIVTDSTGDVAVVECLKGGIKIYIGDEINYKVLSNNNYDESIKYLAHFKGYGGDIPIRKDLSSQGRFVSAASMLDDTCNGTVENCFQILNEIKQGDTRWQFVYDTENKVVYYKTHDENTLSTASFDDFNAIQNNRYARPLYGEMRQKFKITDKTNRQHLFWINDRLKEDIPGKEHIYTMMGEAGKESLRQK